MTPTDTQLKQALAKMLPDLIAIANGSKEPEHQYLFWLNIQPFDYIKDTELLHLCWLVEENLGDFDKHTEYENIFEEMFLSGENGYDFTMLHATWQQRTLALCKVKEIEIV